MWASPTTGAATRWLGVGATIVAAAAGTPQLLHGSGPMPPKLWLDTGAIWKALGLPARRDPAVVTGDIERDDAGYLDARAFAPEVFALRWFREEVWLRTVFSTLEKVYDLATAPHHIIGMTHAPYLERLTGAMQQLGWPRSFVVQGLDDSGDVLTSRGSRLLIVSQSRSRRRGSIRPRSGRNRPGMRIWPAHRTPQLTRRRCRR